MASKSSHMEYSIWQWKLTSVLIPKVLHMAPKNDQMEYSMWHEIVPTFRTQAVRTTPYR